MQCVDVVRDIAMSSWNVSLEQLPYYVTQHFGLDTTVDSVDFVRQESLTQGQWVLLDTIVYWARIWSSK